MKAATDYQRGLAKAADDKAEAAMTDVTFTTLTPEELKAFSDKVVPIVDLVKQKAGADLVDRLLAAAK